MLYDTVVQRDETGLNQIYEAVRAFEEENVMEAIIDCKFDYKKLDQTLALVRIYQNRLNIESAELVEFSEHFIEQYATDNNKCFRVAERLLRQIRTTITGSVKIFRQFCPKVRHRYDSRGRVVPVLDHSRLTVRHYNGHLFDADAYDERLQTLAHELAVFFYHLLTTLKLCKDMIRKEEQVRGDYGRLKEIFDKSCEEALKSLRGVFDTFGQVKLVTDEELEERRRNARPLKEWIASDYHCHDKQWMKRQAYFRELKSGSQYGLDEKASVLWANNPEWGKEVCALMARLDTLNLGFKRSKKAEQAGKKGTFDARVMAYMLKWSRVSRVSDDGTTVIDEAREKQFYLYLQEKYTGECMLPTWQAVCRERKFLYSQGITQEHMAQCFAEHIPQKENAA